MPKTPAQARYKKLKQIYEHAKREREAELDPQQKLEDSKADYLPILETTIQADNSADTNDGGQFNITTSNSSQSVV